MINYPRNEMKSIDNMDLEKIFEKEVNVENLTDRETDREISIYNEIFENIKKKSMEKIQFQQPILEIMDYPLLYPNSILIIQGAKGVHKSRFAESLASVFISESNNCLGLKSNVNVGDAFVCFFDSERNLVDQLPFSVQNVKRLAGFEIEEFPDNFYCTSFVNTNRNDRLKHLISVTKNLRSQNVNKSLILIIDVLTDFVSSFNDVFSSLQLTDFLNDMINRFDCSIVGVIHQNPVINNNKARGHLGTEAVNKASSVIQIGMERDSELITLNYLALRGHKLPKEKIYLKYDENISGLVLVEKNTDSKNNSKELEVFNFLKDKLSNNQMCQKDLVSVMEEKFGSKNTIVKLLQKISNQDFGDYRFCRKKVNQNVMYYIEEIGKNEISPLI